jgi:F-type H+-transporting ATPase subunit epsilon
MKTLNLEVITPSKPAYEGIITSVTVPGTVGAFQVLYNHAPILSTLEVGIVVIKESTGKVLKFTTGGGTVEVLNNKVLLLVESFESPDEIDIKRAEDSLQRAKKRLSKETGEEKIDITRAEVSLKRAVNRLKLTGHYFK